MVIESSPKLIVIRKNAVSPLLLTFNIKCVLMQLYIVLALVFLSFIVFIPSINRVIINATKKTVVVILFTTEKIFVASIEI